MRKIYHSWFFRSLLLVFISISSFPLQARADAADAAADAVDAAIGDLVSGVEKALNDVIKGVTGSIFSAIDALFAAIFGGTTCSGSGTLGDVLCNVVASSDNLPGFLTAISYTIGIILAVTALIKLKDHVLDPHRTPISDSLKRFVAGGALFSLPIVTEAAQNLITGGHSSTLSATDYAGDVSGGGGLDTMMVALFRDTFVPMMDLLNGFAYLAGIVLTVVGITRIIKTAQDGPRGPAGLGTIMTFVVAGMLFSSSTLVGAFSTSMFGTDQVATFAVLQTSTGDDAVDAHILAVISSVLVFMTIVGWISFLRGFFILREVAEGSGQASLMASLTHLFGGALAVNLGPLMNAVQSTFGLDAFGVAFE